MAASQSFFFLAMALSYLLTIVESRAMVPLSEENRIIGGDEVVIYQVPWQVSIQVDGYHICGGAIISKQWILTAAHCTSDYNAYQLKIRVGSNDKYEGGTVYKVRKVMVHEGYNEFKLINDISAVKTASMIKFGPAVSKVALPRQKSWRPPVGTQLRVSGFGLVEGRQRQTRLRAVDIELVNFDKCKRYFKGTNPETQLCAGSQTKKICDGDSGGPLVMGEVLVGIVSYSDDECTSPGDGYTDVAFYRGWIKSHTGI